MGGGGELVVLPGDQNREPAGDSDGLAARLGEEAGAGRLGRAGGGGAHADAVGGADLPGWAAQYTALMDTRSLDRPAGVGYRIPDMVEYLIG